MTDSPTFRAVAWDVDGTLIDSEPLHWQGMITVAEDLGMALPDDAARRFHGESAETIWTILAPTAPEGLTQDRWRARLFDRYCEAVTGLPPLPGAIEAIHALARAGIPQIAVSNAGRRVLDANLDHLGIGGFLLGSISVDDVPRGKPFPDPYLAGAKLLGLTPREVLAVEDSGTGARSARKAGMGLAALGTAQTVGGTPIASVAEVPGLVLGLALGPRGDLR